MKRAGRILKKILHPPMWVQLTVPVLSFAALIIIFAYKKTENASAYVIFGMSAYSLAVWVAGVPSLVKKAKNAVMKTGIVRKAASSKLAARYFGDLSFRGNISLCQGLAVSCFYCIFRIVAAMHFASAWFLSMAIYYLVLCGLRAYLIVCCRRSNPSNDRRCYCAAARMLFLLNVSMGGMVFWMVKANSAFNYPGSMIYLNALYAFYAMANSIVNLVKFHKFGSLILSAAKAVDVVAAMMSVLGLQTALLSRFSGDDEVYRRMMNSVTGGFVCGFVILIALYMLLRGRRLKEAPNDFGFRGDDPDSGFSQKEG